LTKLVPVDFDPFAGEDASAQQQEPTNVKLTPVDGNPFAEEDEAALVAAYNRRNPNDTVESLPDRSGVLGRAAELGMGMVNAVRDQFPQDMARIARGFTGGTPGDDSYFTKVIEENQRDMEGRLPSKQVVGMDTLAESLSQGPASIATSLATGVAGGMLGAKAGALAGSPGGPSGAAAGGVIGAMVGAGTLSGAAFYNLAKDQFLDEMYQKAQQANPNLTQEDWKALSEALDADATEFGLWEAGPEAVSQFFTAGLVKGVGGKVLSKMFPGAAGGIARIGENAIARATAKLAAEVGEEEVTEATTFMGQEGIRQRVGLRDDAPTLREFANTQAGPVAVGSVLQIGGMSAAERANAWRKGIGGDTFVDETVQADASQSQPAPIPTNKPINLLIPEVLPPEQNALPSGGQYALPEGTGAMPHGTDATGISPIPTKADMPSGPTIAMQPTLALPQDATDAPAGMWPGGRSQLSYPYGGGMRNDIAGVAPEEVMPIGGPNEQHKAFVAEALNSGKEIPLDVLASYGMADQQAQEQTLADELDALPSMDDPEDVFAPVSPAPTMAAAEQNVAIEPQAVEPAAQGMAQSPSIGGFDLKPISDKAFVVTGDTKPIKDQLKSAGGKWNPKHKGWMFSNKRKDQVNGILVAIGGQKHEQREIKPSPLDAFEQKGIEPWQVTQTEWLDIMRGHHEALGEESRPEVEHKEYHRSVVKDAIEQGRRVPDAVLQDYQEFTTRPTAAAPEVRNEAQPAQEAAPLEQPVAQEDVSSKIDNAKRRLRDAINDLKRAQFSNKDKRDEKAQKVAQIEGEIRKLRDTVFNEEQPVAAKQEEHGVTLDEARNTLANLKVELSKQGQESQVHDARLMDKVKQYESLVSELEAEESRPAAKEEIASPKADAVESKQEESPKEVDNGTAYEEPRRVPAVERATDMADGQPAGSTAGNVQESEGTDEAPGRADGARSVGGDARKGSGDARGRSSRNQHGDGSASGRAGTEQRESAGADADGGAQEVPDLGRQSAGQNAQNHRVAEGDTIVPGGTVARAKANIAAIKLLKELQAENRAATPEEKRVLTQFTGWGSLAQEVFKPEFDNAAEYEGRYGRPYPSLTYNRQASEAYDKWKERYGKALHPALGGMMTAEEWDAAKKSTLNAHYTDRSVINAMWSMAERMGFTGGRVLEPSAGTGLFFGLMPEGISEKSRLVGVELDSITGGILQKLYPDADIQVTGFENAKRIGDNSFDMVISNFPFGSFQVYDKARPEYSKQSIHNYFFSRAIDAVKPGGLVMGITSHFTLDAGGTGKVREMWGQKADLVAAVRLPGTAFEKNAGTQVTTDIIILRKKTDTPYQGEQFRHLAEVQTPEGPTQINEYFVQHPEMVLGEHSLQGSMYGGKDEYTLKPSKGESLDAALKRVAELLPQNIAGRDIAVANDIAPVQAADDGMREGTIVEKDGKVFMVVDGALEAPEWASNAKKASQAKAYLGVKSAALELINAMNTEYGDANVNRLRARLNEVYDAYVKEHGHINKRGNKHLEDDLEFPTVAALETIGQIPVDKKFQTGPKKGQKYTVRENVFSKADIFSKRTIYPFTEPTTAESLSDAVKISRVYRNGVNVPYIARLLRMDVEDARAALLKTGDVFENPENGLVEPKDIYLSGNVREKLRIAERAAEDNPAYMGNVEALQKVMPERLSIDAIHVRIGSAWVPAEIMKSFMEHIGISYPRVERIRIDGEEGSTQWEVYGTPGADARNRWGVDGASALDLVRDSLNLKRAEVFDTVYEDNKSKRVKNPQKSLAAQEKQRALQEEFRRWVKENDEAAKKVEDVYNDTFNGHVARKFDAPDIKYYPCASQTIELRENQKIGVSRALQESTLLAHGVGSGKTFLLITLAMEMRRLGTAKKPWIVVQGSTLPQFAASFKRLYPGARILAPNEEQRKAKNRQRLLAQIASGDWDAVITPHGFFNSISIDPENEARFINERIEEFEEQIRADYGDKALTNKRDNNPTVKAIQRKIEKMKVRLQKLTDTKKDANIFFEQLGVDALIIDEAHAYKRGDFYTKMDNVKGLDRDSSQRSMQMLMKSRHVQGKTGGKNVVMATGTPISNTLTEMWTMFRYTRPDLLRAFGVEQFDDFASTFADTTVSLEETSTGDFKDVERFNRFVNGPELLTMWRMGADVAITENLNYIKGLPKLAGGKVQEVAVERSEALTNYIRSLKAERDAWDKLSGKEKRESSHVPLVIYGKAKKAAIDLRLVDADLADTPGSKANAVVDSVFERWQQHKDTKAAQIIFSDIFQSSDKRFNLFHDIRDKLIARGVPAGEIAIIHDFKTDDARGKLFDKVNAGTVRVLMGTTEKLGVGVNVQERLVAAHHIDAPLRPMDFEQRNGRIRRPGNMFPEVEVFAYGTKNTLDSVTFQQLIAKQKFINQMMRGDIGNRVFENPFDEVQSTFEDMMAAFSGNPLAKEKMKLQADIRRLESLHSAYTSRLSNMRYELRHAKTMLDGAQKQLPKDEKAVAFVEKNFPGGKVENRKKIMQAIGEWLEPAENTAVQSIADVKSQDHWRTLNPKKLSQTRTFVLGNGMKAEVTVTPGVYFDGEGKVEERYAMTSYELAGPHGIEDSQSFTGASGMMTRVENFLSRVMDRVKMTEKRIANQQKQIASLEAELKKPFEQAKELDQARTRMDEIEAALAASANEDLEAAKASREEQHGEAGDTEKETKKPAPERNPTSLADALRKAKSAREAVKYVANTTTNESYRLIANRVMEDLGADVELVVVDPGVSVKGGVPTSLNAAAGVYRDEGEGKRKAIFLRSDEFGEHGMHEETVLHEALHAITLQKIAEGNLVKNKGTALFDAVQDLYRLQNAVVRELNKRGEGGTATEYEKKLVTQLAVSDVKELVSWGMTNRQFQDMLESIPYEGSNAFTRFVGSVLKALGISKNQRNALTELVRVTDAIASANSIVNQRYLRAWHAKAGGMKAADVQKALDPLLGSLFAGVNVKVVQSAQELPEVSYKRMVADNATNAMGVHRGGINYLIADNIPTAEDVMFVLKHELFHDGMRRMRERYAKKYGRDEAFKKMNLFLDLAFAANKKEILKLADAYRHDFPDLSEAKNRRGLTEEWLGNMAHANAPKWFDRYVAAVRQFLRAVADRLGIKLRFSDSELRDFIRRVQSETGDYGKDGSASYARPESASTAGANTPDEIAEAQRMWAEMGTESPYFKKWFGDSKVVDNSGKPLLQSGFHNILRPNQGLEDSTTGKWEIVSTKELPDDPRLKKHKRVLRVWGLENEHGDAMGWATFSEDGELIKTGSEYITKPTQAALDRAVEDARKIADLRKAPGFSDADKYYRFGSPPEDGRSRHIISGKRERGVSVYRAVANVFGNYSRDPDIAFPYYGMSLFDRPIYEVEGKRVGKGSDGEPVLKDVQIVRQLPTPDVAEMYGIKLMDANDPRISYMRPEGMPSAKEVAQVFDGFETGDIGELGPLLRLPHWLAKKVPSLRKVVDRQFEREERRSSALSQSIEAMPELFGKDRLKGEERQKLIEFLWKWDGKKVKALENTPKFVPVESKSAEKMREAQAILARAKADVMSEGFSENDLQNDTAMAHGLERQLTRAEAVAWPKVAMIGGYRLATNREVLEASQHPAAKALLAYKQAQSAAAKIRPALRANLKKNEEWDKAYAEWVKSEGLSGKVASAAINVRKALDDAFVRGYNRLALMAETPDTMLEEMRSLFMHLDNYMPHSRTGAYGVAVYDKDGEALYREHFDAPNKAVAKIRADKRLKELRKKYPEAGRFWAGVNKGMPEEIYEQFLSMDAMEKMLFAAVDKSVDDAAVAADLKKGITMAASDEFKARGWLSHSIGRKNVPGFERENIEKVLFDYFAGHHGFLEKVDAARDMASALKKIDPKTRPNEHAYVVQYVKDMLRNSDKIDRVVGNIKALAFVWYLGGVMKTAAVNATQNIVSGAPTLGLWTKGSSHVRIFDAAMRSVVKGRLSEDEQRLVKELHENGLTQANLIREVQGRVSGKFGSVGNRVISALGWPMAAAERFNRVSLALAAYRAARSGALNDKARSEFGIAGKADYEQAKAFAESIVRDAHFVYGKSNLPQPLRSSKAGRVASAAYTFRSFNHNMLEMWANALVRHGWKDGGKAVLSSMAGTMVLGGLRAAPFFATAMALTNWLAPLFGGSGDDDWLEKIAKMLPKADWMRDMILFGVPSLAGVDIGGSLRLEAPMVDRNAKYRHGDILGDIVGEALGIPYALVQSVGRAKSAVEAGAPARAVEEIAPVALKNAMAAYRLSTEGAHSITGTPIKDPLTQKPKTLSATEAVFKALGFQAVSQTKASLTQNAVDRTEAVRADKANLLSNRIANAARDNNIDAVKANLRAWKEWNAKAKSDGKPSLLILPQDMKARLRARLAERKTSPRQALRIMQMIDAYGK